MDMAGATFTLPQCSPLRPVNRYLWKNALTSLEDAVFDNNTALIYLCVDPP
jgi:hypothetical protein